MPGKTVNQNMDTGSIFSTKHNEASESEEKMTTENKLKLIKNIYKQHGQI